MSTFGFGTDHYLSKLDSSITDKMSMLMREKKMFDVFDDLTLAKMFSAETSLPISFFKDYLGLQARRLWLEGEHKVGDMFYTTYTNGVTPPVFTIVFEKNDPIYFTIAFMHKLHPFEGHPYKVVDDESMEELKNSIAEKGLLNRIIVRPLENTQDEYEIISGHRRVHAAELLGVKEVPAVVYFIDRDEATVLMVDSNCQRDSVSPVEKGKAYRMKSEALSHQGVASGQVVPKSDDNRTTAQIGADAGESYKTVQRFIRLTYLTPELQEYVDTGKMKVSPAVEISFLDEERQRDIVDCIEETDIFPSHAQTRRMRQLDIEGKLDYESIKEIMSELKPNQVEKIKIPIESIRQYAPRGATPKDMEELLIRLAKENYQRECRMRDDGAR